MKNPFIADDSGKIPAYIAGRENEISDLKRIATLVEDSRKKNILITGLRGVGKTVLLNYLSAELVRKDWLPVILTVYENKGRRTKELLAYVIEEFAIALEKVGGSEGVLDSFREIYKKADGSNEVKIQAVIEFGVNEAVRLGKKGVMLAFDEAQFIIDNKSIDEYPRSTILNILSRIQANSLPFFYAFCGLPNLLHSLQESKPNIERAFSYYERLEYLSDKDSEDLIRKTLDRTDPRITFSDELIKRIVVLSAGYPYFLQYYGGRIIAEIDGKNHIEVKDFEIIEKKVIDDLDKKFYDSRFDLISDSDRKYFIVTLSLPRPFQPKDLLEGYNKKYPEDEKSQNAIRQAIFRLTQKGILLKKPIGYDYTIPLIGEYISRRTSKETEIF